MTLNSFRVDRLAERPVERIHIAGKERCNRQRGSPFTGQSTESGTLPRHSSCTLGLLQTPCAVERKGWTMLRGYRQRYQSPQFWNSEDLDETGAASVIGIGTQILLLCRV